MISHRSRDIGEYRDISPKRALCLGTFPKTEIVHYEFPINIDHSGNLPQFGCFAADFARPGGDHPLAGVDDPLSTSVSYRKPRPCSLLP